jgi:hypothetical protein
VRLALGGVALMAAICVTGCSGGVESINQPQIAPQTDLDTAKPPPQTVTSTPLLPPVPEPPATAAPSGGLPAQAPATSEPPLQYDQLYSDDEQLRIKADLAAAAAKVKGD